MYVQGNDLKSLRRKLYNFQTSFWRISKVLTYEEIVGDAKKGFQGAFWVYFGSCEWIQCNNA